MKNYFRNWTAFQKRYIPIFIAMSVALVFSFIYIFASPAITKMLIMEHTKTTKSGWPVRVAAPYIDMSSWVDTSSAYSNNGAPNLAKVAEESGFKYFNLGFIQPDMETPLNTDGSIRWGWGGYYLLNPDNSNNNQYKGIVKALDDHRANGGDFCISIGGQVGDAPWVVTQDQSKLEAFYEDVITTYKIKRMDLDIEESNQDKNQNIINAKAIKKIQDKTDIEITLTVPIMPSGWQQKQIDIINAYVEAGIDITLINSMTMCYGSGVEEGEDYGWASLRAIRNSIRQMKEIYANHGMNLTDEEAYLKTGATFSIGYENSLYPVFTLDMARTVVNDAIKYNYGQISMWSMGRDAMLDSNSAITSQYNYSNILKTFIEDTK